MRRRRVPVAIISALALALVAAGPAHPASASAIRPGGRRDIVAILLVQFYTNDRYAVGPIPFLGLVFSAATRSFL